MKWPGVWGRKEWAGEGKKEREEREKKEREKSRANHGKNWQHITRETNQVSLFLLPTKEVFIWDNKYNKCGIDKKQNRMKDKNTQEKGCSREIKSQINVTEHRIN